MPRRPKRPSTKNTITETKLRPLQMDELKAFQTEHFARLVGFASRYLRRRIDIGDSNAPPIASTRY